MHYTRGQVSSEAEAIVNNTALGTVTDAAINRVLNKVYTGWEWGFLARSATLTFATAVASVSLPSDYNGHIHFKVRDTSQNPVYEHNVSWVDYSKYILIQVPNQVGTVPSVYTISPKVSHDSTGAKGNLLIWPTFQDTTNKVCKLFYYYNPTLHVEGSSGDSEVPLFMNYNFLVEATVNELYRYMRDQRWQPRFVEQHIDEIRTNLPDNGIVSVPEMGLDARRFKSHRARFGG